MQACIDRNFSQDGIDDRCFSLLGAPVYIPKQNTLAKMEGNSKKLLETLASIKLAESERLLIFIPDLEDAHHHSISR